MKSYSEHINIDLARDLIRRERYRKFALVKTRHGMYIAPVKRVGGVLYKFGCVYDNADIHGTEMLSMPELLLKFTLIFGYTVKYEFNEKTRCLTKL